jgi:hypothetical protein
MNPEISRYTVTKLLGHLLRAGLVIVVHPENQPELDTRLSKGLNTGSLAP